MYTSALSTSPSRPGRSPFPPDQKSGRSHRHVRGVPDWPGGTGTMAPDAVIPSPPPSSCTPPAADPSPPPGAGGCAGRTITVYSAPVSHSASGSMDARASPEFFRGCSSGLASVPPPDDADPSQSSPAAAGTPPRGATAAEA